MAGAPACEAGQTAASPAGRTEEEERRKEVKDQSSHIDLETSGMQYADV